MFLSSGLYRKACLSFAATLLFSASGNAQSWVQRPGTSQWYSYGTNSDWTSCESFANSWGGHLVAINSDEENTWLRDNFFSGQSYTWIGLNDVAVEGTWEWTSSETVSYTNWDIGEPSGGSSSQGWGEEDGVIAFADGTWNDTGYLWTTPTSVVELESDDCNGNGQPDLYEIATGSASDGNGNSIPDECEPNPSQWVQSPINNHWYATIGTSSWSQCRTSAELLGCQLATIRSSEESSWIESTFSDSYWIGLYQDTAASDYSEPGGAWGWVSGEEFTYNDWATGQPNDNNNDEHWAHLNADGFWYDSPNDSFKPGLIEICSTDCDGNSTPDSLQILADTSLDTDGNGVLDSCESGSPGQDPVFTMATYNVGSTPRGVKAADLNADGWMDLISINSGDDTISVLMGASDGSLTPAPGSPHSVASGPYDGATGDFNGDGHLDIAVNGSNTDRVSILYGNGDGTFAPETSVTAEGGVWDVAAGDLNSDGHLDLVATNGTANTISVMLNDGAGNFEEFGDSGYQSYSTGARPWAVEIADLDGDGAPDLVVSCSDANRVDLFQGSANGSMSFLSSMPTGSSPRTPAVGDVDGDGFMDVCVPNEGSNSVTVFLNPCASGLIEASFSPLPVGGQPRGVAITDANEDGYNDIVVTIKSGADHAFLGNAVGYSGQSVSLDCGPTPERVIAVDLDGDGDEEVVTVNADNASTLTVLWNQACHPADYFCGDDVAATSASANGARIQFHGLPSVSQDAMSLSTSGLPSNTPGLYIMSPGLQVPAVPFGDGFRCISLFGLKRIHPPVFSDSNGLATKNLSMSHPAFSNVQVSDRRYFELWFRDPSPGFAGFNLSDVAGVTFCP